jgi:hypothetical protein
VLRKLRQENRVFQANLGYIGKPALKKEKKKKKKHIFFMIANRK